MILHFKCVLIYQALVECFSLWLVDILLGTKVVTVVGDELIFFGLALCSKSFSLNKCRRNMWCGYKIIDNMLSFVGLVELGLIHMFMLQYPLMVAIH